MGLLKSRIFELTKCRLGFEDFAVAVVVVALEMFVSVPQLKVFAPGEPQWSFHISWKGVCPILRYQLLKAAEYPS
ncbi:hypothetical protein ACFX1Q_001078 [Malus domestica]